MRRHEKYIQSLRHSLENTIDLHRKNNLVSAWIHDKTCLSMTDDEAIILLALRSLQAYAALAEQIRVMQHTETLTIQMQADADGVCSVLLDKDDNGALCAIKRSMNSQYNY